MAVHVDGVVVYGALMVRVEAQVLLVARQTLVFFMDYSQELRLEIGETR